MDTTRDSRCSTGNKWDSHSSIEECFEDISLSWTSDIAAHHRHCIYIVFSATVHYNHTSHLYIPTSSCIVTFCLYRTYLLLGFSHCLNICCLFLDQGSHSQCHDWHDQMRFL